MSKFIELSEVASLVSDRIDTKKLNLGNYISTENMKPNRGGIVNATKLPPLKTVLHYKENDILISNIRLYFEKIWLADRKGGASSDILILRTKRGCSPQYIYYVLSDSNFFRYADVTSKGTKMPRGDKKAIMKYTIPKFSIEKQAKIADVLSTYDKLIGNNNKRIEILEETAKEIYKEWFVRMRFPGYEDAKFEKGIPEGWAVKKVGDLISFDIGGGWGKDRPEENYLDKAYVIRGTDIPDMKYGNINYELLRYHKKSNLKNRRLKEHDIIFEASGGSANQHLGRTYYVTNEILSMYDEDVICASFCKLIRFDNKYLSWFFNNYLKCAYDLGALSTFEVQSTGISNFRFRNFKKHHKILIPDDSLIKKFYNLTYDIYKEVNKLGKQNQNLIKQRDLLLPRLMNGSIEAK